MTHYDRVPAGLTHSTLYPSLDFETYSEAGFVGDVATNKWKCLPGAPRGEKGLPIVGAAAYAQHESTEVLSLSYDLRDGRGTQRWRPGMPNPADLFAFLAAGGVFSGWNVAFERWIWNFVCVRRYGWKPLAATSVVCAMAKARSFTLPGPLKEAGEVLDVDHKKDADGKRLLDKFSVPRNPTKKDPRTRIRLEDEPVEAERLYVYNDRDIVAEAEINARIPDMTPTEARYWRNDQAINYRGVQIDVAAVDACIPIINQATERYTAELEALAGCKPSELQQLQGWLHAHGVHLDSLDEEHIDDALLGDLPPHCRRALEIRQVVGSASVKKVFAMRNQVTAAGRLHDLYTWHGARTGRPTGNGPQPTNLPKAGPHVYRCGWHKRKPTAVGGCGRHHGGHTYCCPWCDTVRGPDEAAEWSPEAAEDALIVIAGHSLELVQMFFGDAMLTVSGVLRGLFIAAFGKHLISSDFSAIEGVVIAALAGEEWRMDVFRTHGKIYEMSASKSLGIPFEEFAKHQETIGQHHPARKIGKFQELACGFGGWINGWKEFGGPGTDDEIKKNILAWRSASPAIVELWGGQRRRDPEGWGWRAEYFGLEGCAVRAVLSPGDIFEYRGIAYMVHDDVLYCRLLSGRCIPYHHPRLTQAAEDWRGLSLSFEGWNTNPKNGPIGWNRMSTYGARLAENVVQATARDIQMHAIENLELAGYPIVMHTYDEVVAEVPEGWGSVEEVERIMGTLPVWATGWPIKAAGGWAGKRYRKA